MACELRLTIGRPLLSHNGSEEVTGCGIEIRDARGPFDFAVLIEGLRTDIPSPACSVSITAPLPRTIVTAEINRSTEYRDGKVVDPFLSAGRTG
jgi:hypothetical protein